MNNRYVFLLVVILILQSCIKNGESDSFKNYIGTKVDLKVVSEEYLGQKTNKVIIYFDSTDCISCALDNAILWEMHEEDLKRFDLAVMMLCDKSIFKVMLKYMEKYGISLPLLCDVGDRISKDYPFLKEKQFKTFVLDSSNRIIWIGSPIYNEQSWERFCKMINLLNREETKETTSNYILNNHRLFNI